MRTVIWHKLIALFSIAGASNPAIAQITPDRTLGSEQSTINQDLIEGGARRGTNLFHSFEQFNINEGQRINFSNPTGIINIISRVTGGNPSNLLGTLGIQGTANLFLLNPNGIIFGRNARLDIRGSFIASTANSLRLADGTEFRATDTSTNPLLTLAVPLGLQVSPHPGSIRLQGNGQGLRSGNTTPNDANALLVPSNKTLALVGGPITSNGATLRTAGGRLELGSIESGFVTLNPVANGFALSYDPQAIFGEIQLTGATAIDASGRASGDIQAQARRILLQGGSVFENSTLGNNAGGSVKITATESMELSGTTADNPQDTRQFVTAISLDNRGSGTDPVELTLNTGRLTLRGGARISASTREGSGGNLKITARDRIDLIGTGTSPGGLRSSGISVQTRGSGNAGKIEITTPVFSIREGAETSASTFAAGAGGDVNINATRVDVVGASVDRTLKSRIIAEVGNPETIRRGNDPTPVTSATGKGGDVNITTQRLTVQNDGNISVSSQVGQAGTLNIIANAIDLNQGNLTAIIGKDEGANIKLQALDYLLLRNNSLISAQALNTATGGNVEINAQNGFVIAIPNQNNDIIANAAFGRGGRISITTQGIFGIEERRARSQNFTNDIDASSEFAQSGTVTINELNVDPTRGLAELPIEANVPAPLASCQPGGDRGGRFIATGSGGLPTDPADPLSSLSSLDDLALPTSMAGAIAPAKDWSINSKGEVTLLASQRLTVSCSSE
jgi:filamentous hemagglutinin family protein